MIDRSQKYSSDLKSESPWFNEFKKVLALYESGVSLEDIKQKIVRENLFGVGRTSTAETTCRYLLRRLNFMDAELLKLFNNSDLATQKIINFIAIVRGDRLLSDFLNEVYREKIIVGYSELNATDINAFFTDKASHDDVVAKWSDTTLGRLRREYFLLLTDANLLQRDGRKYLITPPILDIALERYLQYNGEERLLKALMGVS